MNDDEFNVWLQRHSAVYPNWDNWLAHLPNAKEVGAVMRERLRNVSLEDALAATEVVAERETQPRSYDRHVYEVAKVAKELRAKRGFAGASQSASPACRYCNDSGVVHAFNGSLVFMGPGGKILSRRIRLERVYGIETASKMYRRTSSVPCFCDRGRPRPSGLDERCYRGLVLAHGVAVVREDSPAGDGLPLIGADGRPKMREVTLANRCYSQLPDAEKKIVDCGPALDCWIEEATSSTMDDDFEF